MRGQTLQPWNHSANTFNALLTALLVGITFWTRILMLLCAWMRKLAAKTLPKGARNTDKQVFKLKKLMGRRGAPELELLASPRVCSIVQIVGNAVLLVV